MVVFLLFCYDLFLYSVDFIVLLKFMDFQYGEFRHSRLQKYLTLMLIAPLSCLLLWSSPLGGTYPFFSVIFSFLFLPFYKGRTQKKLLFSSIQLVVSGYLVTLVLTLLRSFEVNLSYIGMNYYVTLGSMHIVFWLLILLLNRFSKKDSIFLPYRLLNVVLAIPLSSFIVLAFFLIRVNNNQTMLFSLEIPLLCVFIFINIVTAFLYSQFGDLLNKNKEVFLLKQQISMSEQHFQDITEAQQKIKGIRHDMKNHLQTLLHMSNQTPAPIDGMKEYISQLVSTIHDSSQVISTGNLGLDAILSLKITQIKDEQIPVDNKIVVPAGMSIPFDDSIIIFGNLLDNSLEACRNLLPQERYIRLEIVYVRQSLLIRISNPKSSPEAESPAKDGLEHGFGLNNVRTVIQKYNGTMNIEERDTAFCVKIVLYNL